MLILHSCNSWWKYIKYLLVIPILFIVSVGYVSATNDAGEPTLIINEIKDVSTYSILIISGTTNLPDRTTIILSVVVEGGVKTSSSTVENGRFVIPFDVASSHLKSGIYQLKIFDFEKRVYKEESVTILPKVITNNTLKVSKGSLLTISGITDLPEDTLVYISVNINGDYHTLGSYIENGKYFADFATSHWPLGTYQVIIKDSKYNFYKEEYITIIEPVAESTPKQTIQEIPKPAVLETPRPVIQETAKPAIQETPFEIQDLSGFEAVFTLILFISIVIIQKNRKKES